MASPNDPMYLGSSPVGTSPGTGGGSSPYTPNPGSPRHIFDFPIDPYITGSVAPPFKSAFPGLPTALSPQNNSDDGPPLRQPPPPPAASTTNKCSSASPVSAGASFASDSNGSFDSGAGYLDPRPSSSPSAHDMMSGISGNTTPGFETLEEITSLLPELEVIGSDPLSRTQSLPIVNLPQEDAGGDDHGNDDAHHHHVRASIGSANTYPPSPRLTVSPHRSPKVTVSSPAFGPHASPIVKVEHSTPEAHHHSLYYGHDHHHGHHDHNHHYHPNHHNHQRPRSSSSPGLVDGDDGVIHRGEDGSWQGGIDPAGRGSEYLPMSLQELEFHRMKQAKNAEVEEWLRKSMSQLPRQPAHTATTTTTAGGGLAAPKDGRRRAKSVSDFRGGHTLPDGGPIAGPLANGAGASADGNADRGNGEGIVIGEPDDDLEDDDSSLASEGSAWREGSLDESLPETGIKEVPPTEEDLRMEPELDPENDPAFLPRPSQFFSARPWNDPGIPASRGATLAHRNQPGSSNAAMMRFQRCAENIETASRVATFGSNMTRGRRTSAGDADKLLPGPLKRLSFGRDKDKERGKAGAPQRRPSIWGGFRSGLKRGLSNAGDKDKERDKERDRERDKEGDKDKGPDKDKLQSPTDGRRKRGSSFSSIGPSPFKQGILSPSFGPPSLHVETSNVGSAFAQMASPLMAAGAGAGRTSVRGVMNHVRRSRSRSDLQRKHIFGVVSSIVSPALPASPPEPNESAPGRLEKKFTFGEESQSRGREQASKLLSPDSADRNAAGDGDDIEDDDYSPQSARTPGGTKAPLPRHDITPTLDGFAQHVKILAPQLSPKLVERVSHEQCKRFKKLVDHRHKHIEVLKANGCCPNKTKCRSVFGAIGVGSDGIVGVAGKRGNNPNNGNNNTCGDDENGKKYIPDSPVAC